MNACLYDMIEKFITLKNIGKFDSCKAKGQGDVQLRDFTLIFGGNGRGKTTLCAVLRSLCSGDESLIIERQSLGKSGLPEAEILASGTKYVFKDSSWSDKYSKIEVFDSKFVHENVFAGDSVSHQHKKNLHKVIIGKHGIQLAWEIERLDAESRKLAGELKLKKLEIEKAIPNGVSFEQFLGLARQEDIDSSIAIAKKELKASQQAKQVTASSLFATVDLPTLPEGFGELLETSIENVATNVGEQIKEHLTGHTRSATETWLSTGMPYIDDNECPFCGTSLEGNSLIEAYTSYFGEEYATLKTGLERLRNKVELDFGSTSVQKIENIFSANDERNHFWKQFAEFELKRIEGDVCVKDEVESVGESALELILKKLANPLDRISIESPLGFGEEVNCAVRVYNDAVNEANKKLLEIKTSVGDDNVDEKQQRLNYLAAVRSRHDKETEQLCIEYEDILRRKNETDERKKNVRGELESFSEKIFGQYRVRINEILESFNAGFRICDLRRRYTGGHPSTSYVLEINDTPVEAGDASTKLGTPSFRSTLSAGDRSSLALAFFIAQLEQNPDLSETTAVFDDPFNSQDRFRRTCTQELICEIHGEAKQVIVLSHDQGFLKLLWDRTGATKPKTLQLTRIGRKNAIITEWNIVEATESSFDQDRMALHTYHHKGEGNPREIARMLRPFLEEHLRLCFPDQFTKGKWLGDLIEDIRDSSADSPLEQLKSVQLELQKINDFSKRYHHGDSTREHIDEDELNGYVKRTLEFCC